MSEETYWSDLRMPEPSLEPPRTSDPECWCDECRWSTTDGGSWWCTEFDRKIKDLSEACDCGRFKGDWI